MPVLRRKDSKSIFVKFQIGGVIYRQAVPEATSIAQGKIVEAQLRKEVFEGKYGMGKDILFSDFVERHFKPWWAGNFKSDITYLFNVFIRTFKGKALKDIAPLTIEGWKERRATTKTHMGRFPHPATIQNELGILSSIFELACDNDFLSKNPMRKVRRYSQAKVACKRTRLFVGDEEERLFKALERRGGEVLWAPLIARYTGMRQSEVINLKHGHVDFNAWTITINKTKNDRPRTIPVVEKLKPVLLSMPVDRGGFFFTRRTAKSFQGARSAWGRACEEAKISDFRFHDLRHVFASSLPPDPYLRAAWLGHSQIETSHIYSHVNLEEMRRAAEGAKVLDFERTSQPRDVRAKFA